MRNYYLIAFFGACLILSCKEKGSNEETMSTISSSLIEKEDQSKNDFSELSVENYELEAIQILEKGKKRLQVALPITIESQVDLYEETLKKFSEQAVSSRSLDETADNIIDFEAEMLLQMMEDEVKLNKVYFDIVFELEELNKKYAECLDPQGEILFFENYHNSPSIVYSVDIFGKVTEFVNSDAAYQNGKFRGVLFDAFGLLGIGMSFIPNPLKAAGPVVSFVAKGGNIVNDRVMEAQAGVPIPTTISRANNALQNPVEREKLKNELKAKLHLATEDYLRNPANKHLSAAEYESARREFSGFGNRLKGRIGDFSDGIITQPIGHLRNLIEQNVKILKNPAGDLEQI